MTLAFSRRAALAGLGAASTLPALPLLAQAKSPDGVTAYDLSKPEDTLEVFTRLEASSEMEIDVPWWYEGPIYGVRDGELPRPLFRFEGLEIYKFFKRDDGSYFQTGSTLTFFRDFETEEFIYEFDNPYTNKKNEVKPNILGGTGGGYRITTNGRYIEGMKEVFPEKPFVLNWTVSGDMIWLKSSRPYPPGTPLVEAQTVFARLDEFNDPSVKRINSLFSSTYVAPPPAWMEMEGQPGWVIWHAAGRKLASIDDLPKEYLERAQKDHPDRLSVKS